MNYTRLTLRGETAVWFQIILFPFVMAGGLIYSPINLNHPCWIVLAFLAVNVLVNAVSFIYYNSFDPDLRGMKTNMAFGFVKVSAGSLLITGAIMSSSWLGIALVPVFYVLGAIDVAKGASQLQERMYEKQIAERVRELEQRLESRNITANAKTLELAVKQVEVEEALIADLSASLRDYDLDCNDGQEN